MYVRAPQLAREVVDVRVPGAMRFLPEPPGFGPVLGDHQMLRLGEEGNGDVRVMPVGVAAVPVPQLAIAVEDRFAVGELAQERRVVAMPRREVDLVAVGARKP